MLQSFLGEMQINIVEIFILYFGGKIKFHLLKLNIIIGSTMVVK